MGAESAGLTAWRFFFGGYFRNGKYRPRDSVYCDRGPSGLLKDVPRITPGIPPRVPREPSRWVVICHNLNSDQTGPGKTIHPAPRFCNRLPDTARASRKFSIPRLTSAVGCFTFEISEEEMMMTQNQSLHSPSPQYEFWPSSSLLMFHEFGGLDSGGCSCLAFTG